MQNRLFVFPPGIIYHPEISFLISWKRTLNFRNQRSWCHLTADYTIIMFKDTQGHGQSCHVWSRCMQELLLLLCFQLRMVCVAFISMTSQCNRWLKFCGLSIIHLLFMIVSIKNSLWLVLCAPSFHGIGTRSRGCQLSAPWWLLLQLFPQFSKYMTRATSVPVNRQF